MDTASRLILNMSLNQSGARTEQTTGKGRDEIGVEARATGRGNRSSGDGVVREATVCTTRTPLLSPAATAVPAARPPPITSPAYCTRRALAQHRYGTEHLSQWPR